MASGGVDCAEADSAVALPGVVAADVSAGALDDVAVVEVSAGALEDAAGAATSAGALDCWAGGVALGDGLPFAVAVSADTLAEPDADSLAGAFKSSAELSLEVALVKEAWRGDFVPATCFAGVFALGAGVSRGSGVLVGIPSSAFAMTGVGAEFVSAIFAAGAGVGSAFLLKVDGADRVAVLGVDVTWSSTSAPPIATTTIVPKAIGKWFTESSCPWGQSVSDRKAPGRVALLRRQSDDAYRRASAALTLRAPDQA